MSNKLEIEEIIRTLTKMVRTEEKHLDALDGLPGIYYDREEVESIKQRITFYNNIIKWLRVLLNIKENNTNTTLKPVDKETVPDYLERLKNVRDNIKGNALKGDELDKSIEVALRLLDVEIEGVEWCRQW